MAPTDNTEYGGKCQGSVDCRALPHPAHGLCNLVWGKASNASERPEVSKQRPAANLNAMWGRGMRLRRKSMWPSNPLGHLAYRTGATSPNPIGSEADALQSQTSPMDLPAMHLWALLLCGRNTTVHGRIGAAVDGRAAARRRPLHPRCHADGGGGGLTTPPPWVKVAVIV